MLYFLMERSPGGQNLKPNKLAICEIIITSVPKEIAFLKLFFKKMKRMESNCHGKYVA